MLEGKRAYICSPLSDRQKKQRIHNIEMARFYLKRMEELYHCRTFASHAYLPLMLDDTISEERELALSIGKQFLDLCDVLIICGEGSLPVWRGKSAMLLLPGRRCTGTTG